MEDLNRDKKRSIYEDLFQSNNINIKEFMTKIKTYEEEINYLNKTRNIILIEESKNKKKLIVILTNIILIFTMLGVGFVYDNATIACGIISMMLLGGGFCEKNSYEKVKGEIDEIKRGLSEEIENLQAGKALFQRKNINCTNK